jgi:hypothetical protein
MVPVHTHVRHSVFDAKICPECQDKCSLILAPSRRPRAKTEGAKSYSGSYILDRLIRSSV